MVSSSTSNFERPPAPGHGHPTDQTPLAPGSESATFDRGDWCMWALVSAAVLAALIGFVRTDPRFAVEQPLYFETKVRWADGSADVVLAGNSRVYRGLAPSEFPPAWRTLNFGFSSATFDEAYLARCEALLAPAGQRTIVFGVTALNFVNSPDDGFDVALRDAARAKLPFALRRTFGSMQREWFQPVALDLLLRPSGTSRRALREDYVEVFHADGFVGSDYRTHEVARAVESYRAEYEKGKRVDPALVAGFVRRVAELSAGGVRVVAFRMPACPEMDAMEDALAGLDWAALERDLRAAGATWLPLPAGDFVSYDGSHLAEPSAIELSRRVAGAIGRRR